MYFVYIFLAVMHANRRNVYVAFRAIDVFTNAGRLQ